MQNGVEVALTDRRRALIFVNLVVSGIATSILSTAMTTALPNVVASFDVSTAVGQWVTSGYSLAMGMVMPLTAFLITRFPTKRLYIGGNVSSYGLVSLEAGRRLWWALWPVFCSCCGSAVWRSPSSTCGFWRAGHMR